LGNSDGTAKCSTGLERGILLVSSIVLILNGLV